MTYCSELTPLLLGSLCEQWPHLHESCRVNMSILTAKAPFTDTVAVGTGSVVRRHPVKHGPILIGVRAAEQRGALLLGAQIGEHVCAEAETERGLLKKKALCFGSQTLNYFLR